MISEAHFIPTPYDFSIVEGTVKWQAPSNIALVKYWGKKEIQIPANPSVSFTLSGCRTETEVHFSKKQLPEGFSFEFRFEGRPKPDFHPKIQKFLELIALYLPYLKAYHLVIDSRNTFPHSSGIASSASAMAALALCLTDWERILSPMSDTLFYEKASFLARLGSGSACRSVSGQVVVWGKHEKIRPSSDLYGISLPESLLHESFVNYRDTILLVDVGSKQVSSSVGHDLMHNHPFAQQRFAQAHHHLTELLEVLRTGNISKFIHLVEREALTLHAMMMTSDPYFILMKPNTLEIIQKIWSYREQTQIPLCFTLDAGANVHLLYPEAYHDQIGSFVRESLSIYCHNNRFIEDKLGFGASKLI